VLTAFILLIIGSIGLLVNEFAFHWGTTATLVFAALNIVGLVLLGLKLRRSYKIT